MLTELSVLASCTRALPDALRARGIDAEAVLARSALGSAEAVGNTAGHPPGGAPEVWRAATDAVGDPAFGLSVARHVRLTMFHALGYAVMASATLGDALERYSRCESAAGGAVLLELTQGHGKQRLRIKLNHQPHGAAGDAASDAVLAVLVRVFRILYGSFPLAKVELGRARPHNLEVFERFFHCPVGFDSEAAITFEPGTLSLPLPTAESGLALAVDQAVSNYLMGSASRVAHRARASLAKQLLGGAGGPGQLAKELGMSVRTLQRRLGESGTSYADLLWRVRQEHARVYLAQGRSVAEVAVSLGYKDGSAFARAFRRFNGAPPSAYARRNSGSQPR